MNRLSLIVLAGLVSIAVPLNAIAIPSSQIQPLQQTSQNRELLQHHSSNTLVSLDPSNLPVVAVEDWTSKDAKLPWNQLVLHKTSTSEERVVFTKSYKFKVGLVSGRKERIHARWTQNNVEIFIMTGFGCSWIFGCESGVSYALPKQIKVTAGEKEYVLSTIDQGTYALTPDLKQVIAQSPTPPKFQVDERIKFEVKEEAIPVLKQLFTLPESVSPTVPVSPNLSTPTPIPNLP